jgi:predicted methyltransferase
MNDTNETNERNFGPQPIADIMAKLNLKPHDLVAAASGLQLTHKMVSRACKGRKLTINTKVKILNALNIAAKKEYTLKDLFNY